MQFSADSRELADAVAWASRALGTHTTQPILGGIMLTADGDTSTVEVAAFNYDTSRTATIKADVAEPGRVLLPGRVLAEITRALPDKSATLTVDGTRATLTCGTTRFALATMPAEDYPTLPVMPPAAGRVDAETFSTAIAQVAIAVNKDDTLPMLTGVRMEIDGGMITLAATDRYRLAVRELEWAPADPGVQAAVVIPGRQLADLAKTLTPGEVEIGLGDTTSGGVIGFSNGGWRTTTRLLEPEFPKFRQLFPQEFTTHADFKTGELAAAVKRVALVAERNTPVRLTFRAGEVVLEAGSGDEAQAMEVLPVTFDGGEFTIAFNHHYLLDGLTALDADVARLQLTEPTKPAVLTAATSGEESGDYRYLVMPIRTATQ